jgi:hypothetical protein
VHDSLEIDFWQDAVAAEVTEIIRRRTDG